MTEKINESGLIKGIRERDNNSFKYLYDKSFPFISRFVLRHGGTTEDVNDLLQDSMVIVYENITENKFKGDSGLVTYFNKICQNRWFTYIQRKKNKNVLVCNYTDFMNIIYEDSQEDELTERARYAESLLSSSTDRCREILIACYYENLSMEQIAGKLGYTNADNAKNQKAKCMDKLRKAAGNLTYLNM